MFSKVYINAFKIFRKDILEVESEQNKQLIKSRFELFFKELQHKEEDQSQFEHLSTSGSGSSFSLKKKVKPPKTLTIDIFKVLSNEDRRTTLMIKNIPNKFNKEILINILDKKFKGFYDILIIPTNTQDNKNFGYAFINFTHSLHIVYFYHLFNESRWNYTNSKKICQITYSKIQGKSKLKKHYPLKNTFIVESSDSSKRTSSLYIIPNVSTIQ